MTSQGFIPFPSFVTEPHDLYPLITLAQNPQNVGHFTPSFVFFVPHLHIFLQVKENLITTSTFRVI